MSRAFVKEDVDPPERSGRVRSASGLPPGALNYITAGGAARLQLEQDNLRQNGDTDAKRIAELERVLASVTVVDSANDRESVAFGARVTVRDIAGQRKSYRIVGVDELRFYSDGITWISPVGKTLLAAEVGDRVTLEGDEKVEIVKVEFPAD